MRRFFAVFLLLSLVLSGCSSKGQGDLAGERISFRDDSGAMVSVPAAPKTVAVLTSSLADIWQTAGGKVDITVGETLERGFVTSEVILVDDGAGKTINLELLIASQPDFVLYSSDLSGQLECADALKSANIPAAGFAVETFQDYLDLLKISTDILGNPEAYRQHGTLLQQEVEDLIAIAQQQTVQPDILFVRAGSSAKYTKAKTADNHFVCAMLKDLGTNNIADSAPILLDGLSTEEILLSDPDVIFYTTMGEESAGVAYMESLMNDPVWQAMTAVETGRVYQLPKDLFQYKPNSRWDEAYAYLIRLLYGDIV